MSFQEALRRIPGDGSRPPEGAPDEVRLAWAAREMETFFLQELWRAMRRSVPEGGLFPTGAGTRTFEEMLDEERSRLMATSGQLGLAALIYERTLPRVTPPRDGAGGLPPAGGAPDAGKERRAAGPSAPAGRGAPGSETGDV